MWLWSLRLVPISLVMWFDNQVHEPLNQIKAEAINFNSSLKVQFEASEYKTQFISIHKNDLKNVNVTMLERVGIDGESFIE